MTTQETNKELVRRYYEEAFNAGKTELLEELIAEDVINHDPVSDETLSPAEATGYEGFVRHVEAASSAFSDASVTIEDMVAEDDLVAVRFTFEGTFDGVYAGFEPTGERVSSPTMVFFRCVDGKIAERWAVSDDLDFLQQLNILGPVEELAPVEV